MPKLIQFKHRDDFAQEIASMIEGKILDAYNENGLVRIALSGGSTPLPVYQALVNKYDIPWDRVDIYQVDERFNVSSETDSNQYHLTEIFKPLQNQIHGFYMIANQGNLANAASNYNLEIESIKSEDEPIFDLVILGMGDDGHTASLFPNRPVLDEEDSFAVSDTIPNLDLPNRITLTYTSILDSQDTFILIQGEDKIQTLDKVLGPNSNFHQYPIRKIIDEQNHSTIFILNEPKNS